MCFTAEYSIHAFFLNTVGSLLLLYTSKDPEVRAISMFLLFIGIMQIFDYVFWTYPASSQVNVATTKLAMLINHLQPLVLMALVYFQTQSIGTVSKIITLLYCIVALVYSIRAWPRLKGTAKSPDGQGLLWEWNVMPGAPVMYTLFLGAFVTIFLENFKADRGYTYAGLAAGLFAFSYHKYTWQSAGRMWCYVANMLPILILGIESVRRH